MYSSKWPYMEIMTPTRSHNFHKMQQNRAFQSPNANIYLKSGYCKIAK